AQTVKTSVRELEGALVRLIAFASLQNHQINLHIAQDALSDYLTRVEPAMHRSDIDSAVSAYFAVSPADIHSAKRDRTVALARHFSMYLTRKHTSMSLPEIGRSIGNKNHATVL